MRLEPLIVGVMVEDAVDDSSRLLGGGRVRGAPGAEGRVSLLCIAYRLSSLAQCNVSSPK